MLTAITGTPGTGKTSVSENLRKESYKVLDLNKIAIEEELIIKRDKKRESNIVDIEKLDYFLKNKRFDEVIFIEGHLSHLLRSVEKVILLRLHPDKLRINLESKNWGLEKINENIQAEILDIILCETVDIHSEENIFEIDTTDKTTLEITKIIIRIVKNNFRPINKYKIGKIDWSEEIFKYL
jgi:adenylate kinase